MFVYNSRISALAETVKSVAVIMDATAGNSFVSLEGFIVYFHKYLTTVQ
jgi:hypothetical protein